MEDNLAPTWCRVEREAYKPASSRVMSPIVSLTPHFNHLPSAPTDVCDQPTSPLSLVMLLIVSLTPRFNHLPSASTDACDQPTFPLSLPSHR
jgi:hypothetical protein